MNKELTFKDVYKLPLINDYYTRRILSSNGVLTFEKIIDNEVVINNILKIINGESNEVVKKDVSYEQGYIKIGGYHIFRAFDYGYIMINDSFGLSPNEADKIQDDFANWVVNKLKGE